MKTLLLTLGLAIIIGVGALWLRATPKPQTSGTALRAVDKLIPALVSTALNPTVGTPSATPSTIVVRTPTTVTITAQISDPTLISGSVNLLRPGATGTSPTILGVMHDDGRNGDIVAGDQIYTFQVSFNEPAAANLQLQVSAAFKGRLQRILSPAASVEVWNLVQPQTNSGLSFPIPYPSGWIAAPSSNQPSDGLYFSSESEEEAGHGISITLLASSIDSVSLDPSDVFIRQSSQTINGRQWRFVTEQEPDSGLQFYHALLQTTSGVIVVGGNASPSNETIINTMVSLLNP